jgi:hypothetical protein
MNATALLGPQYALKQKSGQLPAFILRHVFLRIQQQLQLRSH